MAQELILISKDRYDRLMKQTSLTDNNGTDGGEKVEHDDNKKEEEKTVKTFSPMIEFSIPKRMNKRAMELYKFVMTQNKKVLSHNEHGELIVKGKCIPGSHIIDLIRHYVCPKKNPPAGDKKFKDILEILHIPKRLILRKKKCQLKQSGGLFVEKKGGRRDIVPGLKNTKEKRQWLKY